LQPATHRDQLITMLAEAAEIEHCLMCTYLYAAFSLTASFDAAGNLGFFPGSTLGNFTPKAAIELLGHLGMCSVPIRGCSSASTLPKIRPF
jgi:uncharacterized SAM-dependent methyltransferase